MPLQIIRQDIIQMAVDAIVNSTNEQLIPGGNGVDAGIHAQAGPELRKALEKIGQCDAGKVVITDGYELRCRHILHTAAPIWSDGSCGEAKLLIACYRNVLAAAERLGCRSLAVPILSAGANGFPKRLALTIATREIRTFLENRDMEIYLVVYSSEMVEISREQERNVREYIDSNYTEHRRLRYGNARSVCDRETFQKLKRKEEDGLPFAEEDDQLFGGEKDLLADFINADCLPFESKEDLPDPGALKPQAFRAARSLDLSREEIERLRLDSVCCFKLITPESSIDDLLGKKPIQLDEGFGEAVVRLRKEKKIPSAILCNRANITKAVLSNIVQSVPGGSKYGYKPKKTTAVAIGIAFHLNRREMNELLEKAGYVLSRSDMSDVIVLFCLEKGIYDIDEVNEILFHYDQPLLGSSF